MPRGQKQMESIKTFMSTNTVCVEVLYYMVQFKSNGNYESASINITPLCRSSGAKSKHQSNVYLKVINSVVLKFIEP